MDTMKRLDELLADHEMTLFDLAKACNINGTFEEFLDNGAIQRWLERLSRLTPNC